MDRTRHGTGAGHARVSPAPLVAGSRLRLPKGVERLSTIAATVMLAALIVTATLSGESDIASVPSVARILGVGTAVLLAWRRQPLPIVVIAAATVTAGLRFIGVG